ncbi:MAG: hypothetical protein ABIH23_29500 [bacterium]
MSVNEDPSTWSLTTVGGIPFKKKEGNTFLFGDEGATAQEVYIIQAERLMDFILESFPAPYVLLGRVFYPRRRYCPGLPALSTMKVSAKTLADGLPIDPFGQHPGAATGTYCPFVEVTIDYGTAQENSEEREPSKPWTFLEISSRGSGEFLTTPPREAVWEMNDGTTQPVSEKDVPQTVTECLVEHTAKWSQIPYTWYYATLVPRMRGLMGKVNDAPMALFSNAPTDTILFQGFSMSQQYTWREGYTGASPVQVELSFVEKNFEGPGEVGPVRVTHQHTYRPGVGWQKIQINGQHLFIQGDLSSMFTP